MLPVCDYKDVFLLETIVLFGRQVKLTSDHNLLHYYFQI